MERPSSASSGADLTVRRMRRISFRRPSCGRFDRDRSALKRQPEGSALLQEFYSDSDIYERDIERIHLRHWLCVGH